VTSPLLSAGRAVGLRPPPIQAEPELTRRIVITALLCLCAVSTAALAQVREVSGGSALGGAGDAILIAQVALLMLVGRGLGEIMQRFGQPTVIGPLIAGLILGPSLLGWAWPAAHAVIFPKNAEQKELITGLANMGVMMLLLLTGMETDLKLVRKVGAPAVAVTVAGVAAPFLCGFLLGQFLPDSILPDPHKRLVTSLFLGTALSISSIKIVAMVVREMDFMRRNLGQIIVSSAIMEDTIGWVIISIALGIAGAGGIAIDTLARTLIGTALFLLVSLTAGRWLVFQLIRWVNDTFVSEYAVITAVLIVMCLMALITQSIGVNTVLGAFVAGVLVGESPILSREIQDGLRGLITAFMMPIFFGLSGLSADLTILKDPKFLLLTAGLIVIASIAKFAGAFTGGRIGGLNARESLALGCAMNARGSTEVIVATIGLSMGMLTQNLYSMIVAMAIITTMAMPPMLRWTLDRLPVEEEEQRRLETEDLDAKGFVSRFERLLIGADDSANGRFASRLAGFIAGHRGIPATVLQLETKNSASNNDTAGKDPSLKQVAAVSAEAGQRAAAREEERPSKAEISGRAEIAKADVAVAREAGKGYDLLFIGLRKMTRADGTFSAQVNRIAREFEGPLALVMAGDQQGASVDAMECNILVPVNGTVVSRSGAELAFALASPKSSSIFALHVSEGTARVGAGDFARRVRFPDRAEKAVIADVSALATRYGFGDIQTAVRTKAPPARGILAEAKRIGAQLIVLGASRRVGDTLFLGHTVEGLLLDWSGALVLVVC
jgi:Kef-type K+ transport system membrane component KefB/nucleotide-binding universal stress UspA family protein